MLYKKLNINMQHTSNLTEKQYSVNKTRNSYRLTSQSRSPVQDTMPTKKEPGSIITSTDYNNVASADRHKIPARRGKSGKLSNGARTHHCFCEGCRRLSTDADGLGNIFCNLS